MAGVARVFAEAGCRGGVIWLDGVSCDPFRYVLPALSTDGIHAAFYSDTKAPPGRVTIGASTASVGWREGAPFLHCHGQWTDAAGGTAMGHLLPFDSVVAADADVWGLGCPQAWFEGLPDTETNFTLFAATGGDAGRGVLLRLRPDEDVTTAIEAVALAHGLTDARVHGIGSICCLSFEDGRRVDCIATEVRIDEGRIAHGRAQIDVSVVDIDGAIHRGRLAAGRNPVGVTFEILIEPAEEARG